MGGANTPVEDGSPPAPAVVCRPRGRALAVAAKCRAAKCRAPLLLATQVAPSFRGNQNQEGMNKNVPANSDQTVTVKEN